MFNSRVANLLLCIDSFQCLELYMVADGQSGSESLFFEVMPENPLRSFSIGELNQLNHDACESINASMLRVSSPMDNR